MGFDFGRLCIGRGTLGLSEVLGENTMSGIPVLGALGGYESDEQKALIKKQEQMAAEMKKRAQQNEQARMNALGQKMLAFNPQNQLMAQMFGPDAAFTPQQFADMAANPLANPAAASQAHQQSLASGKPMTPEQQQEWQRVQEDKRRRAMVQQNMQAPWPGPAPLQQRTPQAARRF